MVKFILLGHGRSGSTLLVKSLGRHSNVRMLGELFNEEAAERERAFHALNRIFPSDQPETRYYRDGDDGEEFLRNGVFYERGWENIHAVGYKMFYVHARRNRQEKKAWDYLVNNRDVHVVHLLRRNLFESFISLQIARKTKEWKRWKTDTKPFTEIEPFALTPKECADYFNQKTAFRIWGRRTFKDHPFLEIEYERDVCANFDNALHSIHDFLGVAREPAQQLLEKQARRHPSQQVTNYEELKEYFRYTLYESFFE
jgi:LPS sulfotransferase NodH